MKLKVTWRDGQTSHDILVTADATVTAGDLAGVLSGVAIGAATTAPHQPTLRTLRVIDTSGRSGQPLPEGVTLVDSGLRSGSLVELAQPREGSRDTGAAAAVLRILDGPDAGTEVGLPAGESRIGRSSDCFVRLNDPMVSKHHARVLVSDRVEVIDDNSSNGVIVGGTRIARIQLGPGDVMLIGGTNVAVTQIAASAAAASTDVAFVRSPRVLARPVESSVELPDAPSAPDPLSFPWLALVAPLAMGAVMMTTMSGSRATSLLFVALSPLLMMGTYLAQRTQSKRKHRASVANFTAELAQFESELSARHQQDRESLLALHPSVAQCVGAVASLNDVLWSRRPEHPEFLHVRLGLGDIPSVTSARRRRAGGIPEYANQALAMERRFGTLTAAPVVADLRSVGGLGLCGDRRALDGVVQAVVIQIASLHSPSEVVLTCVTSHIGKGRWAWLKWLPHSTSPHSPLGDLHLSADPASGKNLLDHLEEVVTTRLEGSGIRPVTRGPLEGEERSDPPILPSVVCIVDDAVVDRARLTRIAELGPDVGVHVLWVCDTKSELPGACRTFVDVGDGTRATVGMVRRGIQLAPLHCEAVEPTTASIIARTLAPLVDAGAPVDDVTDLPRSVPVVTLLGVDAVDDPDVIVNRWRENRSLVIRDGLGPRPLDRPSDLRAIVGHAGSEPFGLDLRKHGPHALVGGTTGAGKSEFLQAWVLGLAHAYSPDRVTFLFVDYKGGAAFAECVKLPHCVGLVTDLSPYLVRRVLRSLRAELRHREHLLNAKGQKDLIDLEKSGDPECPPSLIIVVDEFAALVGEIPEFVDGVVDVAQRGRSLGLHLILATQRPAGVIKDNLRANTNLRVALRMADEHDSQDVLGSQMAAHFDPGIPGRGAAKTGPGRVTQFQSAFPGSRTPSIAPPPSITMTDLDFGHAAPWKLPERGKITQAIPKDIERVVATVRQAAETATVPKPRRPWLDSLAESYDLRGLGRITDTALVLGVIDDPDNQKQDVEYLRPDEDGGNLLFVGAGGSGKSTALRSLAIAAGLAEGAPVHVYGIDMSGSALSLIEDLPNVGSIIQGEDEERVARLLRFLRATIDERSTRYAARRAATLTEYRAITGSSDEARILLLLDGFSTFRAEHEMSVGKGGIFSDFLAVLAEGRGVGVHVAMTADRPTGVPVSVLAAFQRKVVLRQASDDGYLALGVPRDVLSLASKPGRALQVGSPHEIQLAILGVDVNIAAQTRALEGLIAELTPRFARRPDTIKSLPALLPASDMPPAVGPLPVLGCRDSDLALMGFEARGVVMLSGPAQSGRTAAMRWFAESVKRRYPDLPLVHLSARRSSLGGLPIWKSSVTGAENASQLLQVLKELTSRAAPADSPSLAIFIEYLPEFAGNNAVESALTEVVTACRRNGHLLVADGEGPSWAKFSPLLNEAKADRIGLLLQPDVTDGDLLRTPLPRCKRTDFPPGRGYWVKSGKAIKVQLPLVS
ncbi:MAG: FHA domain-containing protein [Actinomycetales bacterium]|jgi:S-DNA-T family DNA segregation ATPase FtsK/SpoIIIE|uniref:FHA domain-containing protein n=1 Tax=Candidatus Phosphoribacter hodrii TaxID=2953743 RepID=A0A9D7XYK7_9MICO|nr:FHA domain-containing protein [Candidatus Phosphoribacter hodrii]MBP8881710.1 FHA domain-containing protein [Dermatophilaceae bacterium]HQH06261.1 FtsK/SpoIIIE domain-containing protein [Phycicoccus sp.]HQK30559.1 FtsK/SpoIIIE domain-containing protein [Phycicoccus sp.]